MTAPGLRDPGPMSVDARLLWDAAAPALKPGEPAEALAALCFSLAMDHRLRARLAAASPAERPRIQSLRGSIQQMARACAWTLGLLPIERVEHVPRDAEGRDAELWRWFARVDPAELDAAVQAALADAAAWRDALTPEEIAHFTTQRRNRDL